MRQDTHKKVFCSSVRHNIQIHINSARQCSEARHNHLMHTSSIVPLQSFGKRFNHFLHKAISVPSVTIICCTLQSLCPRNHLMHTSITLCKCNQCALSYNQLMHTSSNVPSRTYLELERSDRSFYMNIPRKFAMKRIQPQAYNTT